MSPSDRYAPLIVRVAGLPAEAMESFSHPSLMDAITERERLRGELGPMRASLVDCFHQAVRGAAKEERRFLLSVKRCCFNGENLVTHRADPRWALLAEIASTLIDEVVAREEAIAALDAKIEQIYHLESRRERTSIARLSQNHSFMRGVALASPVVAQNFDRLNKRGADDYGRREKRLCLTLLRYASRAALKLSPFATLTRTAIGHVREEVDGFTFVPYGHWRERTAVCLQRELLEQYIYLLLCCRQFIESLPVVVNETLSVEGDGSYRFFRPGHWVFDKTTGACRYDEASFVRIKLEGSLVPWLMAELRDDSRACGELVDGFGVELDVEERYALTQSLAELLAVGFLNPVVPWDRSAPDLERQILGYLDGLSQVSDLEPFRKGLHELTELLESYAEASSPARLLEDSKTQVEGLFHDLAVPAGLPPQIEFHAPRNTFDEDVFLLPGPDRVKEDEIAWLSWDQMQVLLEDLDPLVRFANLYSSRHDLLHTLAALGDRLWPGGAEVDFLELFGRAQPLFEEYVRYRRSPAAQRPPVFNPLKLKAVTELVLWRQRIDQEIVGCFDKTDDDQGYRLCPRRLATLLNRVPAGYAASREFCAFVQPLDEKGRAWVVNVIGEGYGRYSGRFTAAMDHGARERWASYFTALSFLDLNGERVELIDMPCSGGRTIDIHVPQTYRVLKMPGDRSQLPPERVLRLQDLRVRMRGADRFPVLIDRTGQRLLPIQLGSSTPRRRPTILKFLAAFGTGGTPWRYPVNPARVEGGVVVSDRHRIGSTVYARRRWQTELRSWSAQIGLRDEAKAFAEINARRLAIGMPDRVFVRKRNAAFQHKPQYIDFSSPSLVEIFHAMLKTDSGDVILEEALPTPDQFPLSGGRWAAEVQLESLCCRHKDLRRPTGGRSDKQPPTQWAQQEGSQLHEKGQAGQDQRH